MAAILDIGQRWCKCNVCTGIQCKFLNLFCPGTVVGVGGEGEGRVAQICPLFSYCLNTDTSTPFSYSFHRRAPKSLPFHHFVCMQNVLKSNILGDCAKCALRFSDHKTKEMMGLVSFKV